jgi:hypothetical protein
MAYQHTKEGVRRTKKESGWHLVPGVQKAAKKNRRQEDHAEIAAPEHHLPVHPLPLTWTSREQPRYVYCESVHASSRSPWHIREVTEQGLKLGGGIDTPSLCSRVKSGWDLEVRITGKHAGHTCPACLEIHQKLTHHQQEKSHGDRQL